MALSAFSECQAHFKIILIGKRYSLEDHEVYCRHLSQRTGQMIMIPFHMKDREEGICAAQGNCYFLITEKRLWTFVKSEALGVGGGYSSRSTNLMKKWLRQRLLEKRKRFSTFIGDMGNPQTPPYSNDNLVISGLQ